LVRYDGRCDGHKA